MLLPARDGVRLEVDWFAPEKARAAVLVAPAMGVRRRYYHAFARYLADSGVAVLVANYRGMDGSEDPPGARLRDWAELDLAAAAAFLAREAPGVPRAWVGHSIGAQLFGLLPDPQVDRALFVAGQSGHWRGWPSRRGRAAMAALWYLGVPLSTRLLGYLPMKRLGQGEDVPAGVAREWARWGRHPEYLGAYAATLPTDGFRTWRGPMRMIAFSDDAYAPTSTARALARLYRHPPEVEELAPSDLGVREIGHFGPFRERLRDALWAGWVEWLTRPGTSAG